MANAQYSNARAKVLETTLLGDERMIRMAESKSPDDAIKILSEVNFGKGVYVENSLEYDKLITGEEKNLYTFIRETSPLKEFSDFVMFKNDYHNAEVIVKFKYLPERINLSDALLPDGEYSAETMKEKILLDEYGSFPETLKNALKKADEEFVSCRATGRGVNELFKNALYEELYKLSRKNSDLKRIYDAKADFTNVGVALRSRDYRFACDSFLKGGTLNDAQLKALCEQPLESLVLSEPKSDANDYFALATESAVKGEALTEFEKKADEFPLSYLDSFKYSVEGIRPFMRYVYEKLNELENVRIIMSGLFNGESAEKIKKRLRNCNER